jgi:hypothetical protein
MPPLDLELLAKDRQAITEAVALITAIVERWCVNEERHDVLHALGNLKTELYFARLYSNV